MTPAARLQAAVALLEAMEAAGRRPADAVANNFFRERRYIGGGDRRAISDEVWFVLRHQQRLDWWLQRVELPAAPRSRVAAARVLEGAQVRLDSLFSGGRFAPEPLRPEEATALGRLAGGRLEHPDMPPAVRFEVPDWLLPQLESRFGTALEAEMRALAEPAPLDLRVNLLKATREQAQQSLLAEGLQAEPMARSPWGLRLPGRQNVTATAAFRDGLVEIQDEGSQLVVQLVGAAPQMRVADFCAGAGGKTLALAMTMRNQGHIVACDVSAARLDGAVRRLRRAGVHNVERHLLTDGAKWLKRRAGGFDRVLVDAPCTGTGTWRRNPDARLRLVERDLAELTVKQAAILRDAARLVRPGGRMVYATCSLLEAENERQVEAFLAGVPGFTLVPVSAGEQSMRLSPARDGTDGFFAAVLERGEAAGS